MILHWHWTTQLLRICHLSDMRFSWVLLFCFFSSGFSSGKFRRGKARDSDDGDKCADLNRSNSDFKAIEARLAALKAAVNAAVAMQEAKVYSILKEASTSLKNKAKASSKALKNRRRASELAERSKAQMSLALDSRNVEPRSGHSKISSFRFPSVSHLMDKSKKNQGALLLAAKRAEAAASVFRSLANSPQSLMTEGDSRSDHDYTYDNVDDYVNDDETNSTELYYTIFDYDGGLKNKNILKISPGDLLQESPPSLKFGGGTEIGGY